MEKNNSSYVGAPYNFVPIYKDVVEVEKKQMETHDKIDDQLLTGEITYSVEAKTPIYISDGKKSPDGKDISEFTKNERGEYVIPGSSMRGLIRCNAQILGLSSFDDDIDDYRLMYRTVAGGAKKDKERYNEILGSGKIDLGSGKQLSILKNVKAGYIAKKGNEYVIYQTDVDKISSQLQEMNYYVLSERTIAEDMKNGKTSYPFFQKHPECAEHKLKYGFKKNGNTGTSNEASYKEGYYPVSYKIKDLRKVVAVGESRQYEKEGCLVCTGYMKDKKAKYIVPKLNTTKPYIPIPKDDVDSFKIDYNHRVNTFSNDETKRFFNLPDEEEIKPVFYIELDGKIYFGFTPRLRLFYDYKIKDGFYQNKVEFDYAKSLFGTIHDKVGYKSKVAFTDAILQGESKKGKENSVILADPKPTSYLDYLEQSEQTEITYNTNDFKLRGIKQYWLHKDIEESVKVKNDKVYTKMRPLDCGSKFKGSIRFQNLTKAELGLLLWSVKLENNSFMNIGRGKPYGYGAIQVANVDLKIFDPSKAYSLEDTLEVDPMVESNVSDYVDAYKIEINSKIKEESIDKLPSITTFFKMHNSTLIPSNKVTRYMILDEYNKRKKILPSVDDVIADSRKTNREKKKLEDGAIVQAEVKDYQGKKVKFYISGKYISVPIENIEGIDDLNKKNMKEKLPKGDNFSVKIFCQGDMTKLQIM